MLRTLLKPLSFLPALILMYMIFSFSAQPGDVSSQLSYKVSVKIVETADYIFDANLDYYQIDEWANKINFITRKLAHMTEYFALAIAVSFPLYVYGVHGILLMLIAGLICVGFACGDEYHQSFVMGRSPSMKDVCIDSVGIFFGIILVRMIGWTGRKTIFKPKQKKKKKRKLFGRKSQTVYYDEYADPYQMPPRNNSGYYPNQPQNTAGYYQNQPQNAAGYYQSQPQNTAGYYQNQPQNGTGYYRNQPRNAAGYNPNQPQNTAGCYQNQSPDGNGYYRNQSQSGADYYQNQPQNTAGCYQNQSPDGNGYYRNQPQNGTGYYRNQQQDGTAYYQNQQQDGAACYQNQSRNGTGYYQNQPQNEAEYYQDPSARGTNDPTSPYWEPEKEIDFNLKPEYPEREYQEENDPYDNDWGFDSNKPLPHYPDRASAASGSKASGSSKASTGNRATPNGSTAPGGNMPTGTPVPPHKKKKKHEKDWFFDL